MIKIEKVIEIYDYYKAVEKDVKNFIIKKEQDRSWRLSWYIREVDGKKYFYFGQACTDLQNLCWDEDSITGNASGSYTMSTIVAERNLVGNLSLLEEALTDFGEDGSDFLIRGPEWADITIRCHIVDAVVNNVLTDYQIKHHLGDVPVDNGDINPDDLPM